jgi:putative DNA primase/helicase
MTLLDPHGDTPASLPKKESDIGTTARHRHLLAFDNISGLKWDVSDSLCKLSTGLSVSQRSLYTNGELYQYTVTRPVILNGIPNLVNRDDLARRVISLHLDKIPPEKNGKGISQVKRDFLKDNPAILGRSLGYLGGLPSAMLTP